MSAICSMLLVSLLAAGIAALPQDVRASTITSTKTVTTTATSTSFIPTTTVCVSLVNATAACRRRRNHWIDVPIVLALDDDSDDFLETYFNPSAVLRVQATKRPEPIVFDEELSSESVIAPSLAEERPLTGFRVASPIYFTQLANLLSSAFNIPSVVFTTSTATNTKVVTATTTTSTKTLVVSGCSPPLSFQTC